VAEHDGAIRGGVLRRDDLYRVEEFAQAGAGQLRLLIEEVALRQQHQTMVSGQRLDRLPHSFEQLDGMVQHLVSPLEDPLHFRARHPRLGELDGGLDHRQDEALDAVAEVAEVLHLRGEEPVPHPLRGMVGRQHPGELRLRGVEDRLVVPERVVRVERDHVDHGHES
jgi:hypothetical protein